LTSDQKSTRVGFIYSTEPTTEKWKNGKKTEKTTDMLRSIGKQSGVSVKSFANKKRKVGRIC